ncbi:hypothetical protein BDP27DRAFT_1450682 [Rhodocollybia butyracea]|uniref:Uncharacterized protein n=1 Tax=Rhodocollybia butyracea TaxID=206335 RepID=A0A9P5PMA3_9AGAR|nr:hypothetical protein BDP27DRAFT_1450682 [Rhodocollybia butyracea]
MPPQKRKLSDLSTPDVTNITGALFTFTEGLDENDEGTKPLLEDFRRILQKLRVTAAQPTSFSSATKDDLNRAKIFFQNLEWKEDGKVSAAEHGLFAKTNSFLSFENTQTMISIILSHVPQVNEMASRMLTDLVLLHLASTHSDETEAVTVIPDYTVMKTKTTFDGIHSYGGVMDYLVAKYPKEYSNAMLCDPISILERESITEKRQSNIFEAKNLASMRDNIAQVVLAAAATCQQEGKKCTRGALTDGNTWIFFTYSQVDSGGGNYGLTAEITLGEHAERLPLILGLLRDWLDNAHDPNLQYFNAV